MSVSSCASSTRVGMVFLWVCLNYFLGGCRLDGIFELTCRSLEEFLRSS